MPSLRRSRSWPSWPAVSHVRLRPARATSAPPERFGRDASGLFGLALPAASNDERMFVERWLNLAQQQPLPQDWDEWRARCEAMLAIRTWGHAAAATAAARRALAEREPTEEERIIGSGWLSHELPNYPRLDTWGRLPVQEDDVPGLPGEHGSKDDESAPEEEDPSTWPYRQPELAGWREEYIDFCEVVRSCARRRACLDLPAVSCTSYSPCVLCRYHPGANLPCRSYWRSISLKEIDELIAEREAERTLRDETIRRSHALRSQRERDTIHDWNWNRRSTSRSRSPTVRDGAISVRGRLSRSISRAALVSDNASTGLAEGAKELALSW